MSNDNNSEKRRQDRYLAVSAFFRHLMLAEAQRRIGWFATQADQPRVQIKDAGWNRSLQSTDPIVTAWLYGEFMKFHKRSPEPWELREVSRWLDMQALVTAMRLTTATVDPEADIDTDREPDLADDDPSLVALTLFLEDNNVFRAGRVVISHFERDAKLAYPELVKLAVKMGVSRKSLPELASGFSQRLNSYQRQGVIRAVYGLDFETQHRHYGARWVFRSVGDSGHGREWVGDDGSGDDDGNLFDILASLPPG
jgi:hypothetical protein